MTKCLPCLEIACNCLQVTKSMWLNGSIFVAFVEDNATISSIPYFENHASYFVQNRRK